MKKPKEEFEKKTKASEKEIIARKKRESKKYLESEKGKIARKKREEKEMSKYFPLMIRLRRDHPDLDKIRSLKADQKRQAIFDYIEKHNFE